ncbi:hypothetical protein NC651_035721 [Populus alba x Populus x berolinensis]|nr:hypothetical protein NC651_035721 [Populus alba x Populus x berolinensis]
MFNTAAACGIIYPNSDEEDSISWKLGSNGNLSIKATKVDCGVLFSNQNTVRWIGFPPKLSSLGGGEKPMLIVLHACSKMRDKGSFAF